MEVSEIVGVKLTDILITEAEKLLAIAEVEQVIKSYCNINKVPVELNFTWANMVVDLLRFQHAANNPGGGELDDINVGDVSALKIGDTNITLGGNSTSAYSRGIKSHRADLDSLVMSYKSQLQKFRRMVW